MCAVLIALRCKKKREEKELPTKHEAKESREKCYRERKESAKNWNLCKNSHTLCAVIFSAIMSEPFCGGAEAIARRQGVRLMFMMVLI